MVKYLEELLVLNLVDDDDEDDDYQGDAYSDNPYDYYRGRNLCLLEERSTID